MAGILGTNVLTQVALVVRDIEKTKKKFAEFFGVPVPNTVDGGKYEVTGTVVYGKPAPDANCLMAFFSVGPGVQLEIIQPNGVESCWQDFLDQHGEGLHHIAFGVKNMDEKIKACEDFGLNCVQRGKYGSGTGEYAYLDGQKDLKCFIELLENY
jgi:catechol 2,3-dioxygenase-like lactoylglutathione lyase family enzyme